LNIDQSKQKHKEHEAALSYWPEGFDEGQQDTKRHFKMLETALPIVTSIRAKNILTIGDNRGRDAAFFKKKAGCHVTASDLDISKLLPAKADGFIDDCQVIDVEKIAFADDSFDIVVVKESFHHWPRPMLGFYEALRVAKYGLILIEPNDCIGQGATSPYLNVNSYTDEYEEVVNYKYQISLREVLKSCWSLYIDHVVVKGFNDPYTAEYSFDTWFEEKKKLDMLGTEGQRQFNLITTFVEKKSGSIDLSLLELSGYKIYSRPKNPFI
jgi:SAM-dependent methyltransferase